MFGKTGKVIYSLALIMYLTGVVISKCIMTGNIMSHIFDQTKVLNNYYFWLILFFILSAGLSFKDVASIKSI